MANEVDIAELIHKGGIFTDIDGDTPNEIYEKLSKMINLPDGVTAEDVYNGLSARENILSTAVGNGIALPHARTPIMKSDDSQMIVVVYLKKPLEMKAPDERDVTTMFVLLTANSQVHLKVLSTLAGLFRSARFRKALEDKAGEETLSALIRELD